MESKCTVCDNKILPILATKFFQLLSIQERESSQVAELRSELESCQQQCIDLQQQVEFLQEQADNAVKNLENNNKALICELEEKLRREKLDCQELRKQLLVSGTNLTEEVIKFL